MSSDVNVDLDFGFCSRNDLSWSDTLFDKPLTANLLAHCCLNKLSPSKNFSYISAIGQKLNRGYHCRDSGIVLIRQKMDHNLHDTSDDVTG